MNKYFLIISLLLTQVFLVAYREVAAAKNLFGLVTHSKDFITKTALKATISKNVPSVKPAWILNYLPNGIPQELADQVEFIKNPKKFTRLGARLPKGLLLYGPPGTGKTTIARALAAVIKAPFIAASGTDFTSEFYGGSKKVRELFDNARKRAEKEGKAIVFVDEIDVIVPIRGSRGSEGYLEQTTEFLKQLDGFDDLSNIYFLAATNRKDSIDPAFLRGGRVETHVYIPLPDEDDRKSILKFYMNKITYDGTSLTQKLARQTEGFSGAQLKKLVNDAAILAGSESALAVKKEHLFQALELIKL